MYYLLTPEEEDRRLYPPPRRTTPPDYAPVDWTRGDSGDEQPERPSAPPPVETGEDEGSEPGGSQ
jgi:hypothetical protein